MLDTPAPHVDRDGRRHEPVGTYREQIARVFATEPPVWTYEHKRRLLRTLREDTAFRDELAELLGIAGVRR